MLKRLVSGLAVFGFVFSMLMLNVSAEYQQDGYLYTVTDNQATITGINSNIGNSIVIPSKLGEYDVTEIGYEVFYNCYNLKSIELPCSIASIGERAFLGCGITSIIIPESVRIIEKQAFWGCIDLDTINIPDSVTQIGYCAFNETEYYEDDSNWEDDILYIDNHLIAAKTDVLGVKTVKEGTKTIADYAFRFCDDLSTVKLPDSIVRIGDYGLGWVYDYTYRDYVKLDNFTIQGYIGTGVEEYAVENGFEFIALGSILPEFAKGDVNADGSINATDFMQVRRHFLGLYTIPEEHIAVADVNGDGNINATDFMQIRRHFLGLFEIA